MKLSVSADDYEVTLRSSRFNLCLYTNDDHCMVTKGNEGTYLNET